MPLRGVSEGNKLIEEVRSAVALWLARFTKEEGILFVHICALQRRASEIDLLKLKTRGLYNSASSLLPAPILWDN